MKFSFPRGTRRSNSGRLRSRRLLVEPLEDRVVLSGDFGFALGFAVGHEFGVGAECVAVDQDGDVYLAGNFSGTLDLDGSGPEPAIVGRGGTDVLLAKYSSQGNLLWSRVFGAAGFDRVRDLAVDGFGGAYLTGSFQEAVDFDPSPNGQALVTADGTDAFVVKFSSAGDFRWVRVFAGAGHSEGTAVAADPAGAVVAAGVFDGQVDLHPGREAGETRLAVSQGDLDGFAVKLTGEGVFVWAGTLGGQNADYVADVAVDGRGEVLLTGDFSGTTDLDPGAGKTETAARGGRDVFVAKWRSGGTLAWAKTLGGNQSDVAAAVAVDGRGAAYVTGSFQGVADFDPGPAEYRLTSKDTTEFAGDIFLTKLDAAGNFVWANSLGTNNTQSDTASALAVLASGDVYLVGPLPDAENQAVVVKYNYAGQLQWQAALTGNHWTTAAGVAVDLRGHVYLAGGFQGTTDFDPGPEQFLLSNPVPASAAIFLARLDDAAIGDLVWQDDNRNDRLDVGESGFAGLVVELFDSVDGVAGNADDVSLGTRTTNEDGYFTFQNPPPGRLYLQFRIPAGYALARSLRGTDRAVDSDPNPLTGRTAVMEFAAGEGYTGWDAGVFSTVAYPWQNPRDIYDVDDNGTVAPLDVLRLINRINSGRGSDLPVPPTADDSPAPFFDVSRDNKLTPLDVLLVINYLNSLPTAASGEGEAPVLEVLDSDVLDAASPWDPTALHNDVRRNF